MTNMPESPANARPSGVPDGANPRLQELHQAHAPALEQFLAQWTFGEPHLTGRLTHETLVRASRVLEQVDAPHELTRAWLFTIARRVVIEFRRSQRAATRDATTGTKDPKTLEASGRDEDPTAAIPAALGRVSDRHITLALTRVSPEHRRVVVELFCRGRTVRETAEVLAVAEATVRSRAYGALRALRSSIDSGAEIATHEASA